MSVSGHLSATRSDEQLLRDFGVCLAGRGSAPVGLLAAVTALVAVDWTGRSDDAGQVSMLVLLAAASALGFAAPRRAWLSAVLLGSVLAVAGMLHAALGLPPAQHTSPGGIAGAATLFVLLVPAALGTAAGAGIRRLATRG